MVTDLFVDFDSLIQMLVAEARTGHWLDAFLLSAAAHQVLEDHLLGEGWPLRRVAVYGRQSPRPTIRAASQVAGLVDHAWVALRTTSGRGRSLAHVGQRTGQLTEDLWAAAQSPVLADHVALARRTAELADIGEVLARHGALGGEVARVPSCFRSFDQRPEDMNALAAEMSHRWSSPRRPVVVVGVRTSGGYLAPICAAALRRLGHESVIVTTVRPGAPVPAMTLRVLRQTAASGGLAVVLDDPPTTGSSVAKTVGLLARLGFSGEAIVLALATFDQGGQLPAILDPTPRVTLPWGRWAVHRQLDPDAVRHTLQRLLPAFSVKGVVPDGPLGAADRGHVKATFRVELEAANGSTQARLVVAEGVGLGYFGRQALAVARAIPSLVPDIIGFADGILYRYWIPEEVRCTDRAFAPEWAPAIAAHVVGRASALPARADQASRLRGRQPAWEVASGIASGVLGPRTALLLRRAVVDPTVQAALEVSSPSVIDGGTAGQHWFIPDPHERAVKVNFAEGAFSHLDLASYDPVFDLAGVAVGVDDLAFGRQLRTTYEAMTGARIEAERWALYQLVHVWNARRLGHLPGHEASRASARILQSYFAEHYLDDLEHHSSGSWCALDLDGVLETSPLGFSATTAVGALALRALVAHGYQPVVVTGRSLREVADRTDRYGLVGGVAEYGAEVYIAECARTVDLTPVESRSALERLRRYVSEQSGLSVDPAYERIVRVSISGHHTGPRGLSRSQTDELLNASSTAGELVAVQGQAQTDFVLTGIDKAKGLRRLLALVGSDTAPPLDLAIGDSESDLPMLALARLALAPANADPVLRHAGVPTTRRPFQAGVWEAVRRLIGHRPGRCRVCRPPGHGTVADDVLRLLSLREAGSLGLPLRLARLAISTARGSKT